MKVSLILSTYNWPQALSLSLLSACQQTYDDYEIIVADDGSGPDTAQAIARVQAQTQTQTGKTILHAWHADSGFRLAMIRNRAVAQSTGDYLIFVDGDCLLHPRFIANHVWLAQQGYFVAGSRVQFAPDITTRLLTQPDTLPDMGRTALIKHWLQRQIRRIHPIAKWPFHALRYRRTTRWQGAVGCNLAVWRRDFEAINGFDNDFIGWGREDSEFVMRLIHSGILRKDGKLASFVLHLHHKKGSGLPTPDNQARFEATLRQQLRKAASGLRQVQGLE